MLSHEIWRTAHSLASPLPQEHATKAALASQHPAPTSSTPSRSTPRTRQTSRPSTTRTLPTRLPFLTRCALPAPVLSSPGLTGFMRANRWARFRRRFTSSTKARSRSRSRTPRRRRRTLRSRTSRRASTRRCVSRSSRLLRCRPVADGCLALQFPPEYKKLFHTKFIPASPPELLDYPGAELLLIPSKHEAVQDIGEKAEKELDKEEKDLENSIEHQANGGEAKKALKEMGLEGLIDGKALEGHWE